MKKEDQIKRLALYYTQLLSEPPSYPKLLHKSGKTITEVAETLHCDRRTASKLIKNNLSEADIGRWDVSHKKLTGYTGIINSFIDNNVSKYTSLLSFSKALCSVLNEQGYTGSERTVRNYLNKQKRIRMYFESRKQKGIQYAESNKHG